MRLSVPWTALVFLLVQGVLPAYTGTITKPTRNWGCDAFPIQTSKPSCMANTSPLLISNSKKDWQQHGTICQRHLGASVRVSERWVQERGSTREGLARLHLGGDRPHDLLHPQRGELLSLHDVTIIAR